ncbi:MAG: hypothetical protein AWU55_1645 [Halomonadaceae bacterium T82-2]|nr:MAG: hypothetical protein AWU55_1645 [Halomonadaceae bacterium T82-2]
MSFLGSAASPHPRGSTVQRAAAQDDHRGFPAPAGIDPRTDACCRRPGRLPRTRGDRPPLLIWPPSMKAASPHPRGSTRVDRVVLGVGPGFPAPAGIDPREPRRSPVRGGLPRTRGDRPSSGSGSGMRIRASPHPRGSTPSSRWSRLGVRGFPAPAGIDPLEISRSAMPSGLPRTRGDRPPEPEAAAILAEASPHPRGSTLRRVAVLAADWGFPAPAGIDPRPPPSTPNSCRLPRTRGDRPRLVEIDQMDVMASPHPRGSTQAATRDARDRLGFPAPAGIDPPSRPGGFRRRGLPRTRGDRPTAHLARQDHGMASPHPRGSTPALRCSVCWRLGFPAPAGIDPARSRPGRGPRRLPRTRGDRPDLCIDVGLAGKASPHPRGSTPAGRCRPRGRSGFPAPAGIDPTRRAGRRRRCRLPRTRGDRPFPKVYWGLIFEASPHPRGSTPNRKDTAFEYYGFPAPAGIDPRGGAGIRLAGGLPRTRGDRPMPGVTKPCAKPASPHPRGSTPACRPSRCRRRGFPAPAGIDPSRRK